MARDPAQRGFTLIELVMVLILIGVLSVMAMPRLSLFFATSPMAARDQVAATLRLAQKYAVSHRRLVCAAIGTHTVTLTIATTNPASGCTGEVLSAPGGSANQLSVRGSLALSSTPGSTLHFQPAGRVSSDAAGANVANFDITVSIGGEAARTITVNGQTGAVL